jgi:hypothetical protein
MAIDLAFEPVSGKGAIYAYTIMYHAGDKRFACGRPYASDHRRARRRARRAAGRESAGGAVHRGEGGPAVEVVFEQLNDDITLPQFRLAPTRVAEEIHRMWEQRCKVAVSGVGFSRVTRSARFRWRRTRSRR